MGRWTIWMVGAFVTLFAGAAAAQFKPMLVSGHLGSSDSAVLVQFSRDLTHSEFGSLERSGVSFLRHPDGREVALGGIYQARLTDADSLQSLATFHLTKRIEPARDLGILFPTEVTTVAAAIEPIHRLPFAGQRGAGQTIATLDSGVDVLHPHFFHADGGYFAWIDSNGDGEFSPGLDHIDFNADGTGDQIELLWVLDGADLQGFGGDVSNDDDQLDPSKDWLYIDFNEDGARNAGLEAGFEEEDLAYGEPLFVVDDVNLNGRLDLDEKLVQLGTSKIQKIRDGELEFVRGVNLIESQQAANFGYSFHGTGVASILVGGQPGHHARVGVAPDADLIVYVVEGRFLGNSESEARQLEYMDDAVNSGVSVVLHEWTSPFTAPHDGSTLIEQALDAARLSGIVQVTPVGNLNQSQKHFQGSVPQAGLDLPFVVGEGWQVKDALAAFEQVYGSFVWGQEPLSFTLQTPSGAVFAIPSDGTPVDTPGGRVSATLDVTPKLNQHLIFRLEKTGGLEQGTWVWNVSGAESDLMARISDAYSGWGAGVHWVTPSADFGTIVHPSTADNAFGVAAYGVRDGSGLRNFSGRGPRLDGAQVIDITAPDDPYAAIASTEEIRDAGVGSSWFVTFGGTSGAAPHVAGTFALFRQHSPNKSVADMEAAIRESASVEGIGAVPNSSWGWGRLNAFEALYEGSLSGAGNTPPVASLVVVDSGLSAKSSYDPDESGRLQFRFDADYDGVWDSDWVVDSEFEGPVGAVSKVIVRDAYGGFGGALASTSGPQDQDMGPDMDSEPGGIPSTDCECSQSEASATALGWVWLLLLLAWTRRDKAQWHPS